MSLRCKLFGAAVSAALMSLVSGAFAGDTATSSDQREGIAQINSAVLELDQMTQQNAALVEQSAAAAESLGEQARKRAGVVGAFRLAPEMPADLAANQPFSPAADCRY